MAEWAQGRAYAILHVAALGVHGNGGNRMAHRVNAFPSFNMRKKIEKSPLHMYVWVSISFAMLTLHRSEKVRNVSRRDCLVRLFCKAE